MATVLVLIRATPESPGKTESLREGLEKLGAKKIEEEPIGFGLKAFKAFFEIEDAGGEQDKLEEKVKSIPGIGNIEIISASRCI